MSKIIDFSSVYEGMSVNKRLHSIKKELEKEAISKRKLHLLKTELYQLSLFLTKELKKQATLTQFTISLFLAQQAELGTLIFACQNLFVDKKVDHLIQSAQKIAKESQDPYKNISQKVHKLQKSISSLTHQEALSLENRHLIHLAKCYLTDAINHDYTHDLSKKSQNIRLDFKKAQEQKDLLDVHETSLMLYEIAGHFYYHELQEAFALFYSLSPSLQDTLKHNLSQLGGCFSLLKDLNDLSLWKNNLYLTIQTLIGYSHELAYGVKEYPSIKEINTLFKDLDKIRKENISANF
jgi:hypothetical protein